METKDKTNLELIDKETELEEQARERANLIKP